MQEIIFRLFGYSMCKSSRKTKFIQTQPPEQRDGLLKPNIENLQDDKSIFFPNIIEYYENRPDALEHISLAHFAAYYEYFQVMYCTLIYCTVVKCILYCTVLNYTVMYCIFSIFK